MTSDGRAGSFPRMRRRPERWSTPFGSWVARFTVARVAEELRARGDPIRRATVYGWLSGVIAPRPPRALAMVELSGGVIHVGRRVPAPTADRGGGDAMSVAAVAENRQTTEAHARRLRFATSLESRGFGLIRMPGHGPPRAYQVYSGPAGGVDGLVSYIEDLQAIMAKSPEARRRYETSLRDAMNLLARRGYAALRRGERGELEKALRFLRLGRVDERVLRRAFLGVLARSGGRAKNWRTAVWRTAHDFLAELSEEGEEVRPKWGPAIARHRALTERRMCADGQYAADLEDYWAWGASPEREEEARQAQALASRERLAALVRKARLRTPKQRRLAAEVLAGTPTEVALKELGYSKDVERGLVENLRRAAM